MRNLQEQVKKAFCYQKLFWLYTVWINCSSDLKNFANSQPSAPNFKSFFRSLEQFFLTVGQNNFGNKIPFPYAPFSCSQIHKLHHFDINWSHHFSFSAHSDSSQFYLCTSVSVIEKCFSKNSNRTNFWLDWLCFLAGNSQMTPTIFNILIFLG